MTVPAPDARVILPTPDTAAADAIPVLVERFGPRLYALGARLCGNAADAQDLVQDVFLQAFRKWHTYRGDASPGTWLYTIAARSCRARMKRKSRHHRRMPAASQLLPWKETTNLDIPISEEDSSPIRAAIQNESAEAVHQAILQLPENFRVPLVLKEMLELSLDEVGEALNIRPETVKTRVHRARLMLRQALMRKRSLPKRAAKQPAYEKQVCLDLLRAKLDAMDQGRGFPIPQRVVCERCQSVFAELDLAQTACARLAEGKLPTKLRAAILRALSAARSSESAVKALPTPSLVSPTRRKDRQQKPRARRSAPRVKRASRPRV
jgi:RNA polymerase sigma-70 factor (ECF subfamily)